MRFGREHEREEDVTDALAAAGGGAALSERLRAAMEGGYPQMVAEVLRALTLLTAPHVRGAALCMLQETAAAAVAHGLREGGLGDAALRRRVCAAACRVMANVLAAAAADAPPGQRHAARGARTRAAARRACSSTAAGGGGGGGGGGG
jgi:hypothetical protein